VLDVCEAAGPLLAGFEDRGDVFANPDLGWCGGVEEVVDRRVRAGEAIVAPASTPSGPTSTHSFIGRLERPHTGRGGTITLPWASRDPRILA